MADEGRDAEAGQALEGRAVGQVRAGDLVAEVEQHFGDAAHARAADADEVDVTNGVLHLASSSQARTTWSTASVFCIDLAFTARSRSAARPVFFSNSASNSGVSSVC